MLARAAVVLMRGFAFWPLSALRGLGVILGVVLFLLAVPRRRVALRNLQLCFPQLTGAQRYRLALQHFIVFSQAWLDRSWLWHGSVQCLRQRLRLVGDLQPLTCGEPIVIFAPHFVGMDAGGTALLGLQGRSMTSIFTNQSNAVINRWIRDGRQRFGNLRLFDREDGVKAILASLRSGVPLYLLPDMNFGPAESIFVPFYGHTAATVPSLSRFARLGRAKVVPVITRLTPWGYEVEVLPAWDDFPSDDVSADTALMNRRLQTWIDTMPAQYYWVHKRFKTRPPGELSLY